MMCGGLTSMNADHNFENPRMDELCENLRMLADSIANFTSNGRLSNKAWLNLKGAKAQIDMLLAQAEKNRGIML